jgi:lipoprotein-anchoring transpeptidase ErfK/SrfK
MVAVICLECTAELSTPITNCEFGSRHLSTVEGIMSAGRRRVTCAILFASVLIIPVAPAFAQTLAYMPPENDSAAYPQYDSQQPGDVAPSSDELPAPLRRQMVAYNTNEPAGTIIIDTAHTFLYLTLGNGQALRYGIGVGREGFTWSGTETITRKAEWPDWIPPAEMVARQPYLPRWVGGGPGNPLGARALYLGNTDYRIHGTNDPTTIGKDVSSGCIRLQNADVEDLYERVGLGAKVIVLPKSQQSVSLGGVGGAQIQARTASVHPSAARLTHAHLAGIY